jgi:hypothetical protein
VPRKALTNASLAGTRGHVSREIADSRWSNDRNAWTIEVIPTAVTRCESADGSWKMLVPADGLSAEVLGSDSRVGRFGLMQCSPLTRPGGVFRQCYTPNVVDAGYRTVFSHAADGSVSVRLAAESIAGPGDLAELTCHALSQ